ncbi:MAG TPA: protein kinase [Vicinamibacterales bacterium]|nr:protein kinase [Vicinamibacterales bacterium]
MADSLIGRTLSHYEVVEEISRGGMGVVYRARDVNLGREVALKVLPEDLVHDRLRGERMLQEARAAALIEHPHIAVIHEVGTAEGVTFIAMELIRGDKLSDVLVRGPLTPKRALDLAVEIAEGLGRAHERGLIHRDLKPANVMITEDGHAKVIDFGLAKLIEPVMPDASTVGAPGPHSTPGLVIGTAAYMSPEQARGDRIDHRTDIFSLGVVLYEMLTARAPFQGKSTLDTLHAILTEPVPPLPTSATFSSDTTAEMQRVIAKCTVKEADERYQGMKDIVVDLRAARRRLESGSGVATATMPPAAAPAPAVSRTRRTPMLVAAAIAIVAVVALVWWWMERRTAPAPSSSGRPSIAVLYFDNNTGDTSLDWIRTGLTDMMVTDLSQSTNIEVLGTDRLYQILKELRRADDRVLSADVVQQVASRAGVDSVLVGGFVKAGDTIRISARLQDARTGRIVSAERVEGPGESSLFSLVDELTRRFKSTFASLGGRGAESLLSKPGQPPEVGLDRGVQDITTSSIQAYRYYAEGIAFHERSLTEQARPLLEKAIEIDPDFAMAYAKLAVVNNNLGLWDKRDEYAKQALARIDRLTSRERYYIEGFYYGLRPETVKRSIEAYQQGLALHPEHQASRHNLGLHFSFLERFPESIEQYEELRRRGTSNPSSYENLAGAYVGMGNAAAARKVADEVVSRYPDSGTAYRVLGQAFMAAGQFDNARAMFEKSEALEPLDFAAKMGRLNVFVLQHRWADGEAVSQELLKSPSPFQKFLGFFGAAALSGARGQGQQTLAIWEKTARIPALSALNRAVARNRQAALLLRMGNPAAALAAAELALPDATNRDPEFETLQLLAVAQAAVGRKAESDKSLSRLESRAAMLPSEREKRRVHWARGQIALDHGDTAAAITELQTAVGSLPAHGPVIGPPSYIASLLYAAAWANLKAGRDADAVPLLERLQTSHDRIFDTDAYARSYFLLAQIYERRNDAARARDQYSRFLDLWRDGDLERGWVAEAQKKIGR